MQREITVNDVESTLNKLEKSKKEYKEGKVHDAKSVFKELREKYEY